MVSLSACYHSKRFWHYFAIYVFQDLFLCLFMGQYRSLGLAHGLSDQMLSQAASLTGISQTVGRFLSSSLYDHLGLKPLFLFMMGATLLISYFIYDTLQYPNRYFLLIQFNFILLCSCNSIFPTHIVKSFGPKYGPQVLTLIMQGSIVGSCVQAVIMQCFSQSLGTRGLF